MFLSHRAEKMAVIHLGSAGDPRETAGVQILTLEKKSQENGLNALNIVGFIIQ